MRKMRRESLGEVINLSINQTLGRTVITAGTALLSAFALFLFGGEVLHGFAFAMIVGIITGTYSSVFVAAAIVTFWHRKSESKLSAAPAAATATPPARRSKSQRKARAS
jgi:preprotein translocase subunit SecF